MNGESGGQKNAAHHAAKDFEESSDRKFYSNEGGIDCSGSSSYLESCNVRECPGIDLIEDI